MDVAAEAPAALLPDYVRRPAEGPYRSLNPTTKLVLAVAEALTAFLLGTWLGPLVALAVVVASAFVAGVLRPLAVVAAIALPVVGSIMLVNTFVLPGATDAIFRIGPLAPTWSGLVFGLQTTLRLLAMSLALALVYLTTDVDDLLVDLERRGLGRRAAFVVGAALQTVPRMVERASEIVDAQRARGLDTEGRFWRRVRGVVPLAAPLIFGALTDVEERTVALEARAFTAPGRRTLLRAPLDRPVERLVRWAAVLLVLALVALKVVPAMPRLP
ncbi:MAG: energy-coupling factor transporter transmembrane component T [Candidatus Limnocylindrales bacterium]